MDNNEGKLLTSADVKNNYMGLLNELKASTDRLLSVLSGDIEEFNIKKNVWQVIQNVICDIEEDFNKKGIEFYKLPEMGLAKVIFFRLIFEGSMTTKQLEKISAYTDLINQCGILKIFYLPFIKKHMKEYVDMCDEISKYNFMDDLEMLLTVRYSVNDYDRFQPHYYEKIFQDDLELLRKYAGEEYANNIKNKFEGVIEKQEIATLKASEKTRKRKID